MDVVTLLAHEIDSGTDGLTVGGIVVEIQYLSNLIQIGRVYAYGRNRGVCHLSTVYKSCGFGYPLLG
jgi:hypothetical protein